MQRERVVVIGAGVGGLSSAALLAARGMDVTVLERASAPGGKMREVVVGGKAIDAGPTVFTMRWVFDQLFAEAGADFGATVTLQPLDVLARHAWNDRDTLDLFADRQASIDAIGAFSGAEEARRHARFCDDAQRTYQTLEGSFLKASRTSPFGLTRRIGLTRLGDIMSIRPHASLWGSLGRYFKDPRLRQLFGRYATYSGSSPFLAPATLMLIAHVEQSGVWSVEGGMHQIAVALEDLAKRQGARFRYDADCAEILVEQGRASGVRLANGDVIAADHIVANCDPSAIGIGMMGNAASHAVAPTPRKSRSLSAFCWTINGGTSGFPLSRHNVFFSADYAAEFTDVFKRDRTPENPTIYICAQDRDQPSAPFTGGNERLQVIVNAPPSGDERPFTQHEIEQCQTKMFAHLQRCGLTISAAPEQIQLTTPQGFNQLFPATGGALYGRASHGWAAAFQRPGARTKLPGLYLAGGATHPGAGVPMAALSGMQAAASLLEDRASMRALHPAATAGGISMRSAKTGASG